MLTPVQCVTCGYPVGDVAKPFRHIRAELIQKQTGSVLNTKAEIDPSLKVDCTKIFEMLHVKSDCCRAVLTTSIEFSKYY